MCTDLAHSHIDANMVLSDIGNSRKDMEQCKNGHLN